MRDAEYRRGSIWWANLDKYVGSSVQSGHRPVVIVSSGVGCRTSDVVTVCPLTTKIKNISVNVSVKPVVSGKPQQVMTNQLVTLPKTGLSSPSGILDDEDMSKVENGIMISLGIQRPVSNVPGSREVKITKSVTPDLDLLDQAKEMVYKLSQLISLAEKGSNSCKVTGSKKRRSKEEIDDFIREWESCPGCKSDIIVKFGFNTYGAAYNFYSYHKGARSDG